MEIHAAHACHIAQNLPRKFVKSDKIDFFENFMSIFGLLQRLYSRRLF